MNGLDIYEYSGEGYRPLAKCGSWLAASLRYAERFTPEGMTYLERHMQTDEVFVLLAGEATLFIGMEMTPIKLEPEKLYTVRAAVWHGIQVSRDANVLVIENSDTSRENSEYFDLPKAN